MNAAFRMRCGPDGVAARHGFEPDVHPTLPSPPAERDPSGNGGPVGLMRFKLQVRASRAARARSRLALSSSPERRRREGGVVFIITLATLAGLVALIAVIALSHREALRAETNRLGAERAEFAARSGLQFAMAALEKSSQMTTTKSDSWASLGAGGDMRYDLARDGFRLQILDACARVNLNMADEDQLKLLPLSQLQVESLLDWRETKTTPRAQGAKDEYYNLLAKPYNTKLQLLDDSTEVLDVRGFTPADLLSAVSDGEGNSQPLGDVLTVDSVSLDQNPLGQPKVDINTATADQLVSWGIPSDYAQAIVQGGQGSYTTLANVLRLAGMSNSVAHILLDYTNIGGAKPHLGLINLNTATLPAINSLPGVSADVAEDVLGHQGIGFKTLGEVADLPGIDIPLLIKIADRICVSSRSFVVRVMGVSGTSRLAIEANVELEDNGKVRVVGERIESLYEAEQFWHWADSPSSETQLAEFS